MLLMSSVDIDETPSCVEPIRQLGGVMLILLDTLCSVLPTLLVVTNIVVYAVKVRKPIQGEFVNIFI